MADQYVALPLTQEAEPSQSRLSGKVTFLSVLISLSCVVLWASDKFNQQAAAIDDATSLAVQPMKQVMQPMKQVRPMTEAWRSAGVAPVQRAAQPRSFMQPRAVFNEVQGATMGSDPSRRAILGGLALLPMLAIADQADAAEERPKLVVTYQKPKLVSNRELKAESFSPYFNYKGDLAVQGKVDAKSFTGEGLYAGQQLSWDLTGTDPKCADGPGDKPNSCGVHIHKGTSCLEDAGPHYFATPQDPWKTITYKTKDGKSTGKDVEVLTELTNADVVGHTFLVHDFEGARIACGILKSESTFKT